MLCELDDDDNNDGDETGIFFSKKMMGEKGSIHKLLSTRQAFAYFNKAIETFVRIIIIPILKTMFCYFVCE